MKSNLTLSVGWVVGDLESKAISASTLKLKLAEAELGNSQNLNDLFSLSLQPILYNIHVTNRVLQYALCS